MRGCISSFEPWAPDGASPSGAVSLPLECPTGSQTGLPRLNPKACSYDPDWLPDGLAPSEAQGV